MRGRHGHVVEAFSFDRGPAQDLILLLQQLDPAPRLTQLSRLTSALAGLGALINIGLAHPLVQGHRVHTEISGDLLDRHTVIAVASDPHDIVAELAGVRPGHKDILPARPCGQANSDVTYSCSRPKRPYRGCGTSSHRHSHIQKSEFAQVMSPIGNTKQHGARHVVCV